MDYLLFIKKHTAHLPMEKGLGSGALYKFSIRRVLIALQHPLQYILAGAVSNIHMYASMGNTKCCVALACHATTSKDRKSVV